MKRLFWIGIGVAGTVVVLRKIQQVSDQVGQVAHAVSPAGIAESVSTLATNLKTAATTLRQEMASNETALSAALLPSAHEQQRARERRSQTRPAEPSAWDDGDDAFF